MKNERAYFWNLLKKVKNNIAIDYRYSSLNDIKHEYKRALAKRYSAAKAEKIVKQIEKRTPKQVLPAYTNLGDTFLSNDRFIITIEFQWRVLPDGEWLDNPEYTFQSNIRNPSANVIQRKAEEVAKQYAQDRMTPEYEIAVRHVHITHHERVKNITSLADIPFYRYILEYPNLSLEEKNNQRFANAKITCGYQLLLQEYPKKAKSVEDLEKFFNKKQNKGLTPNDLLKFCEHYDLSCYVMDLNGKAIVHRLTSLSNRHKDRENNALICTIASAHCYGITDKNIREKIVKGVNYRDLKLIGDNIIEREVEEKQINNKRVFVKELPESLETETNYYINTDKLNDIYFKYLGQGLAYKAKWDINNVKSIYTNENQIHAFEQYELVNQACEDFKFDFKNQSICKLARQLFQNYIEENKYIWHESCFSPEVQDIFDKTDFTKASAFNITWQTEIPENYKVNGLDIRRNYTSIVKKGNFVYFDVHNTVEEYDGDYIEPGIYYIETTNYFPLKGNRFYDYRVVEFCLDENIITKNDIKYVVKGQHSEQMDKTLTSFVDYVYAKSLDDLVKKNIINSLIGSFGINKKEVSKGDILTTSKEEAHYYFWQFGGLATITNYTLENTEKDMNFKLYRTTGFQEVHRFTTNLPIRMQIVQRANIEAYKLYKYIKNYKSTSRHSYIPIAIKTDCVYYARRERDAKIKEINPTEFGGFRTESKIPSVFNPSENERHTKKYIKNNLEWNILMGSETEYFDYKKILDYDRVLIEGFAGSGKTYLINQLQKELGDTFAYCAFTHTAANLIDGHTLHSIFGINFHNKINKKTFKKLIKNKKGIIIDECSMIAMAMYRLLVKLPEDFKLYLFGDFHQIEPVESDKFDYQNSEMLKQIVYRNKIVLRKQCRADAEFANACLKYFDSQNFKDISNFITGNKVQKNLQCKTLNIVKTNLLRVYLNQKMMAKHEGEIVKNNEEFTKIYKGLPVICTKTEQNKRTKKVIYNGEQYIINCIKQDKIFIIQRFYQDIPINKIRAFWLTKDQLLTWFAPAYALTVNKVQGQTINEPYTIWEFTQMNIKSRYTALTRATDCKLITINNTKIKPEELLKLNTGKVAYIYRITDGNKSYIGSTSLTIEQRWEEHKEMKENWKLYQYMREIGIEHFKIEQVAEFNYLHDKHILKVEQFYINLWEPELNEREAYYYK